jgi:hypothetical protein
MRAALVIVAAKEVDIFPLPLPRAAHINHTRRRILQEAGAAAALMAKWQGALGAG